MKLKLYLPRQKSTMNWTLIFFKIVYFTFNTFFSCEFSFIAVHFTPLFVWHEAFKMPSTSSDMRQSFSLGTKKKYEQVLLNSTTLKFCIKNLTIFLSTYIFVNLFDLPYRSYDIRRELDEKPFIISYFPRIFNIQHYKVRIKGKWSNPVAPSLTSRCCCYLKWSRQIAKAFDQGQLTILYIYIYIYNWTLLMNSIYESPNVCWDLN